MKRSTCLAAVLAASLGASGAVAGSLSDPVVKPQIIVEDASGSSDGSLLVALLGYLILIPIID